MYNILTCNYKERGIFMINNFSEFEPKWQKKWEDAKIFKADDISDKPKFYGLVEFPYPSGAGMHVGHIKAYARMGDAFAHASATDAQHAPACEGDTDLLLDSDTQCQLVAIALLIELDDLEQIVVSQLTK